MITLWLGVVILSLASLLMFRRKGHGVSILVPFHCPDEHNQRAKNWRWLKRYWECQLPGAEIVVGRDRISELDSRLPFSKSSAVNDAASRASGDVFVIVDADGYIPADSVMDCVEQIRKARKKGHRLWFVPYRHFYRLTKEASQLILQSQPCDPYQFSCPPPPDCILDTSGSQLGHWYGAGIQIMPREAFEEVGGWDPRFRGWGGEDHAAMRAVDTLYWRHKTLPGQLLHIWHPMLRPQGTDDWVHWRERVWANQTSSGANDELAGKYYGATGDAKRMRKLVEAGRNFETL